MFVQILSKKKFLPFVYIEIKESRGTFQKEEETWKEYQTLATQDDHGTEWSGLW